MSEPNPPQDADVPMPQHVLDIAKAIMTGAKSTMTPQTSAADLLSAYLLVLEHFLQVLIASGADEIAIQQCLLQLLPSHKLATMKTSRKVH